MIHFILIAAAYLFMEFVAWFTHKYIMHKIGWYFHKDHHFKPDTHTSFFEKNDVFFLVFALPAMVLIMIGFLFQKYFALDLGIGITLYGLTYFIIHEIVIHQRLPVTKKIKGRYINALIKAHQAHHHPKSAKEFNCFGLLIFPSKYFKQP